jgi:hypothetical protein
MAHFCIKINTCEMNGRRELRMRVTYSSSIVGLSKIAVDTACASGVDNPAVFLLEHVRVGGLGDFVGASGVDSHDDIPLLISHVGKCLITQDTGVVNEDVDATVVVDRGLDDGFSVENVSFVADCGAAHLLDLVDDVVRVDEVVDDDFGAPLGELKAVSAAKTGDVSMERLEEEKTYPAPPPVTRTTLSLKLSSGPCSLAGSLKAASSLSIALAAPVGYSG